MRGLILRVAVSVVACALLLGVAPARAEVSAEVDLLGNYVRTVVFFKASVSDVRIWEVVWAKPSFVPLNPLGDETRDLWPVILEDPNRGNAPWVVWSRFNGLDYDLVWSRWLDGGWDEIRWLEARQRPGDDLDPDMSLSPSGRPYVAWWTDEGGVGRVYFSVFLNTRWSRAYPVSDEATDSRDPSITVNEDGSITVSFATADGVRTRTFVFVSGHSINDDFDPFSGLESTMSPGE